MPVRCRTGISHKWPTKFKTRPGPPTVKLSVRPGDKKCRDVRDGTGLERYITYEYACCSCYILLTVRREDRRRGRDEYFRDAITLTAAAFSWRLAQKRFWTQRSSNVTSHKKAAGDEWRRDSLILCVRLPTVLLVAPSWNGPPPFIPHSSLPSLHPFLLHLSSQRPPRSRM